MSILAASLAKGKPEYPPSFLAFPYNKRLLLQSERGEGVVRGQKSHNLLRKEIFSMPYPSPGQPRGVGVRSSGIGVQLNSRFSGGPW